MSTLIITTVATAVWRPARIVYRYSWRSWRAIAVGQKDEGRRERWLALFGPLSILLVLIVWLILFSIGWALIYKGLLGQLHGQSDAVSLLYYSGATLLTPTFGDVTSDTALPGMLSLVETVMGFGTIALLISYLPVLYGAYNRREARLLTLDDPTGERITPAAVVRVHSPDGDLERLYAFFAEWELWTAEILESHVSYPMLTYFRSQQLGQSWITALGVVLDAATLVCALVPGAELREPYFMHRRGRRAVAEIARRLHVQPNGTPVVSRELFAYAYNAMQDQGLPMREFEDAFDRINDLRASYGTTLQALFDYLLAPTGFWGHSAELA
ncbi:MAG: hypothetical protein JO247_11725 [Chloroflexi bacterium]|nr:hypothetical protein [Chloroflexota bacterium]